MAKLLEITNCKLCPNLLRVMSGYICKGRSKPGQTAFVRDLTNIPSFCPLPDAKKAKVTTKVVEQEDKGEPASGVSVKSEKKAPTPAPEPKAAKKAAKKSSKKAGKKKKS